MTLVFRRRELITTALGLSGAYLLTSPTDRRQSADRLTPVALRWTSTASTRPHARCSCAAWAVAGRAGCPAAATTAPAMSAAFAPRGLTSHQPFRGNS